MSRMRTARIEPRASKGKPLHWVLIISGEVRHGAAGSLDRYELALAWLSGYTSLPLLEQYEATGEKIFEFKFSRKEALRKLMEVAA